jgi:hypothetical protein
MSHAIAKTIEDARFGARAKARPVAMDFVFKSQRAGGLRPSVRTGTNIEHTRRKIKQTPTAQATTRPTERATWKPPSFAGL